MLKKTVFAGLAVTAALGLAACGDDDKGDSSGAAAPEPAATQPAGGAGDDSGGTGGAAAGGGSSTVTIAADPAGDLAYDKKALSAKAGKVKVDFTNQSQVPHNVTIEAEGDKDVGATETIMKSKTTTTVDLQPGEYEFYCTVGNHKDAGMEGKLTVK